jgi:hypothetical protein
MTRILAAIYEKGAVRLVAEPPQSLCEGRTLKVLVPEGDSFEAEREDWLRLSLLRLSRAYGDDEPEYTVEDLKEVNPDYRGDLTCSAR